MESKWYRVTSVALAVALLALPLAGCVGQQQKAEPPKQEPAAQPAPAPAPAGKELVVPITAEVPLDPQHCWSVLSVTIGSHIMEGLVRVHNGRVLPGIAEKWEISPDGKTYTFHLRDAVWSDGSKVTAYDFEYGMLRLLDPNTASEYAWAAYYIEGAEAFNTGRLKDPAKVGVKALNEKTFQVRLVNPAPYYLGYLSFYFFSPGKKDYVEGLGKAFATDPDKMIYNGPFILKEWKHEAELVLEKNPNYWNKDAIKLDTIRMPIISDPNTALNMYETGQADVVAVPLNLAQKYVSEGKARLRYTGAADWIKINMKNGPAILKNKNFRKALCYALDREQYIKTATRGVYDAATRYVLPVVAGVSKNFVEEYPLEAYPLKADVAKAQEYLQKAMSELGIKNPSDIKIEYLIQDDENTRIMAEAIQDIYRRNLGIDFVPKQVPYKQKLSQDAKCDFQTVYQGWAPDYDDPMTYLELWLSNSSYNSGWANKRYDELINLARSTPDARKRADAMFEAEKILLDEAVVVPLQFRREAWMCKEYVKDLYRYYIGPETDAVFASVEGK